MWRTGKIITEENFMKNVALKIHEGAKPFLTVNIISRFLVHHIMQRKITVFTNNLISF